MSAQQYEPGTLAVATVRGRRVRVTLDPNGDWHDEHTWYDEDQLADVRPLVVLDLHDQEIVGGPECVAPALFAAASYERGAPIPSERHALVVVAEQIEAQTRTNPDEPTHLLAVVIDGGGRKWFRWSYDSHTFQPWRLMGEVHTDTHDDRRWDDLDVVEVLSEGESA